jgi:hypothetical protein
MAAPLRRAFLSIEVRIPEANGPQFGKKHPSYRLTSKESHDDEHRISAVFGSGCVGANHRASNTGKELVEDLDSSGSHARNRYCRNSYCGRATI